MSAVLSALREGKQKIEEEGWIQGELGSRHKGFCAMGAVVYCDAVREGPDFFGMLVCDALYAALPPGYSWDDRSGWSKHPIAVYNDEPGRTREEVLALFDKAIEAEEAKA